MSARPAFDKADAKALLDDRGYTGALIRGQNPALLFEKGVRERITESYYWKEQCFGLNTATLCDRAAELKFIGGTTGIHGKPTPFLCLAFKLLQLVPEKEIILEFLNFREDDEEDDEDMKDGDEDMKDGEKEGEEKEGEEKEGEEKEGEEKQNGEKQNGDADVDADTDSEKKEDLNAAGKLGAWKYLRCLAAFYIRLAWEPVDIYNTLEPLLTDFRKIRRRTKDGFILTHVDQFVDDLLTKDRMCATSLWKLSARSILEDLDMLEPRESPLADEVDDMDEDERSRGSRSSSRSRSRSRSFSRERDSRSWSRDESYSRSRSPSPRRDRSRSKSDEYRRRSRSIDSR
jgi:pre-mRNA-splicing factor 38A